MAAPSTKQPKEPPGGKKTGDESPPGIVMLLNKATAEMPN